MNKLLLGLMAGIAIGVLLAPDKGSETIKKLRGKVNGIMDDAEDAMDKLSGKAKSAFEKGKDKVNEALS